MVGSEVKLVKKISPQDGLTDVGYDEGKIKGSIFDANLAIGEAVARNVRTVGGLQFPSIRSGGALLRSGRDDGPECATVDQPSR